VLTELSRLIKQFLDCVKHSGPQGVVLTLLGNLQAPCVGCSAGNQLTSLHRFPTNELLKVEADEVDNG
jgi:hypothetical protein